eukprot:superscaffoldBa00000280_g3456
MLRWNLQKNMETHPSCSVLLIKILVKELEKMLKRIHKTQSYTHVIPMLHMLYYVVIQSGAMTPTKLYQRVSECLMKLLILPLPYAAVALSILRSIKMEMTTPVLLSRGSLYQRRVIAEQNLKNKLFTLQEKVFVLADPAVFSAPLEATVIADLEASSLLRDTLSQKKNLVLRVLQAGLETASQSSRLVQALGDIPYQQEGSLSLASLLGKVDPWYDSNINSLGAAIPKLAGMDSNHCKPSGRNLFLLDSLCYYLRCGIQPVNLPLYSVKKK